MGGFFFALSHSGRHAKGLGRGRGRGRKEKRKRERQDRTGHGTYNFKLVAMFFFLNAMISLLTEREIIPPLCSTSTVHQQF